MKIPGVILLAIFLSACSAMPEGIKPVANFELDRYTGTWYEIARLDHSFERGLEQVTATYSLNDDGTVRVANKGYKTSSGEWKDAVGKARFAGESDVGHFEVSFFGPFYGPYVIFELDQTEYQYAFVTSSENALWLLSRTPTISVQLKDKFLSTIRAAGYDTDALIFVNQLAASAQ